MHTYYYYINDLEENVGCVISEFAQNCWLMDSEEGYNDETEFHALQGTPILIYLEPASGGGRHILVYSQHYNSWDATQILFRDSCCTSGKCWLYVKSEAFLSQSILKNIVILDNQLKHPAVSK